MKDKIWMFTSFEMVNEHASINYSPNSLTEFSALSQLAAEGLIPNTTFIAVPPYVRVPFQDYLGMQRFDWAQSEKSHWFLRGAMDNYTTNNGLVQQATLPSTGATTHSNYWNAVLSNPVQLQRRIGWERSPLTPAICTARRRATDTSGSRWPFPSVRPRRPSPASKPTATTSLQPRLRRSRSCATRRNISSGTT